MNGSRRLAQLLVVTREASAISALWTIADAHSWRIETVASAWEGLERMQSGNVPDLFLLDLAYGETEGLHIVRWVRRLRADVPILVISSSGDPQQRIETLRLGVQEYLAKPIDPEQIELAIKRHLPEGTIDVEAGIASDGIEKIDDEHFFLAFSPAMHKVRAQAALLAQSDVPVLVVGEHGSGRETVARLIHKLSIRSGFRFLKINCAALTGDLLEKEIFGADSMTRTLPLIRTSALERCENGTILLDQIFEMPLHLQGRIGQLIQSSQPARLRGEPHQSVRLMGMVSAHPEHMVAEHKLRADLYYSLSAFTIHVPPLRQRRDEVPLLLGHFMNLLSRHYGLPPREFSLEALRACEEYDWPGNLPELEKFVKRYLVNGDKAPVVDDTGRDLAFEYAPLAGALGDGNGRVAHGGVVPPLSASGLKSLVETVKGEAERNVIASALEQTRWNRKAAARLLKVSYRTLLYKIQQYNMSPAGYVPPLLGDSGIRRNGSSN